MPAIRDRRPLESSAPSGANYESLKAAVDAPRGPLSEEGEKITVKEASVIAAATKRAIQTATGLPNALDRAEYPPSYALGTFAVRWGEEPFGIHSADHKRMASQNLVDQLATLESGDVAGPRIIGLASILDQARGLATGIDPLEPLSTDVEVLTEQLAKNLARRIEISTKQKGPNELEQELKARLDKLNVAPGVREKVAEFQRDRLRFDLQSEQSKGFRDASLQWISDSAPPKVDATNIGPFATGAIALHAQGYKGGGGLLVSIDTGVNHEADLFADRLEKFFDVVGSDTTWADANGHGTAVMSVAAGASRSTNGTAPEAKVGALRVLDEFGMGRWATVTKAVEKAVEWKKEDPDRPMVVVMPIADTADPGNDPLPAKAAMERATREHGILFVVPSGNVGELGFDVNSEVRPPADSPWLVTVGSLDTGIDNDPKNDSVANSGVGGWSKKVDVVAPGFANAFLERGALPGNTTSIAVGVAGGALLCLLEKITKEKGPAVANELIQSGELIRVLRETSRSVSVGENRPGALDVEAAARKLASAS